MLKEANKVTTFTLPGVPAGGIRTVGQIRGTNTLILHTGQNGMAVALELLTTHTPGAPVVDAHQKFVGFISEFDVLRALEAGKDLSTVTAEDFMVHDHIAVTAETTIEDAVTTNPKDNVPTDIQREGVSGGDTFPDGSGPGTRGNALTGGLEKEKSQPVTRQELEHNAEPGGGAAMAAGELNEKNVEKNVHKSQTTKKGTPHKSTAPHEAGNDGPKKNPKKFRELRSEPSVQGQGLINEQPMDKQQPANRPANERGAGAY